MSLGAAIAVGAVLGLAIGIVVAVTTDIRWRLRPGFCSVCSSAGSGAGRAREDPCGVVVVSGARGGEAFDLVVEGQEALAGQVEAVVGLQLAVGDIDEDPLLEIEQL